MTSSDLDGRTALVTGAGSGIGKAVAELFAQRGARLAGLCLSEDSAAQSVAAYPHAIAVAADVSKVEDVERAFAYVSATIGPPNVVVHAAGIDDVAAKQRVGAQVRAEQPIDILADLTDGQWRRMVEVNLDGAFFVLRAALRSMRASGGGSIVMVGSETGVRGLPGLAHYGATKGGVHALVRSAALEAIRYRVRVNGIAPGVIDTPMSRRSEGVFGSGAVSVAPIGRPGRPDEVANAAYFLASDLSSYVVGEIINVDGGRIAS